MHYVLKSALSKSEATIYQSRGQCKKGCDDFNLLIKSLNSLEDCYFSIVDSLGTIVFISEEFEKIDGFKTNEILGKNVMDVYKLGKQKSVHIKAITEKRVLKNTLLKYPGTNNQTVELVMDIYPVYSGETIIGSVAISRDTSKIQALTDTVLQLQSALNNQIKKTNNNGTQFSFPDIIGPGKRMQSVIQTAKKMARSESRIMILGETGTGKELFAQSIHNESSRAKEPFIAVNCSAIPDTLLESILFGTSKGAFTGAQDKPGLFEEAKNGTLFLDELNSMSLILQSKLLRALETNRVRRVGGNKEISVNPRIISAMNIDPKEAIETDILRSDFYYRLAVITLESPPLRERQEDIITLAWTYINKYNKILGRKIESLSDEVIQIMNRYRWPGNVRELSHCIEHAMNMVDPADTALSVQHLPAFLQHEQMSKRQKEITIKSESNDYKEIMHQFEKDLLTQALKRNSGNMNKTAKEFNLSRQCLYYKLKRLEIDISHEVHIH